VSLGIVRIALVQRPIGQERAAWSGLADPCFAYRNGTRIRVTTSMRTIGAQVADGRSGVRLAISDRHGLTMVVDVAVLRCCTGS
jgi:hypothetical protein